MPTPAFCFSGRSVAIYGLGRSGLSVARAIKLGGGQAYVWDEQEEARDKARALGFQVENLAQISWGSFSALILSPGVPLTHPQPHWVVQKARDCNVPVIGDLELFCRERARLAPRSPFIAITGTNGKSTTTALIAHLFKEAGFDVQLGGNIGTPILDLEPPSLYCVHVIEVSSFQIDLCPSLNPSVGILLNLTPDHIDRHGSFESYAAVKERLIEFSEVALVGVDDVASWSIGHKRRLSLSRRYRSVFPVSVKRELAWGAFLRDTHLIKKEKKKEVFLADIKNIPSLRGLHNAQNACFAALCVSLWPIDFHLIQKGLMTYPGLPHRLETVARFENITFVNDSKATNAEATERALLSFNEDILLIVGGRAKEGGLENLIPFLNKIKKAYVIGEAQPEFLDFLHSKSVPASGCRTLENAISEATRDALEQREREYIILLSPACASYDQFRNFEERGEAFRTYVHSWIAQ